MIPITERVTHLSVGSNSNFPPAGGLRGPPRRFSTGVGLYFQSRSSRPAGPNSAPPRLLDDRAPRSARPLLRRRPHAPPPPLLLRRVIYAVEPAATKAAELTLINQAFH